MLADRKIVGSGVRGKFLGKRLPSSQATAPSKIISRPHQVTSQRECFFSFLRTVAHFVTLFGRVSGEKHKVQESDSAQKRHRSWVRQIFQATSLGSRKAPRQRVGKRKQRQQHQRRVCRTWQLHADFLGISSGVSQHSRFSSRLGTLDKMDSHSRSKSVERAQKQAGALRVCVL